MIPMMALAIKNTSTGKRKLRQLSVQWSPFALALGLTHLP